MVHYVNSALQHLAPEELLAKVLVTGGAGYVGSTVCSALEAAGHLPIIVDSLVTGCVAFTRGREFYHGDVGDPDAVAKVFGAHADIKCVIHCAGLTVVSDSTQDPARYYQENVTKSFSFLDSLRRYSCRNVIFSSSASLYAQSSTFSVDENSPLLAESPYARSKFVIEMALSDYSRAYGMRALSLRYFNPLGADPQLRSGMQTLKPTHVIGRLVEVAAGREPRFEITGVDWPTRDGSGLRDYVHVWDLAQAHVLAVSNFDDVFSKTGNSKQGFAKGNSAYRVLNLGSGQGQTVKELLATFQDVIGRPISVREGASRPGDVAGNIADVSLAKSVLGWESRRTLRSAIEDSLAWDAIRLDVLALDGRTTKALRGKSDPVD